MKRRKGRLLDERPDDLANVPNDRIGRTFPVENQTKGQSDEVVKAFTMLFGALFGGPFGCLFGLLFGSSAGFRLFVRFGGLRANMSFSFVSMIPFSDERRTAAFILPDQSHSERYLWTSLRMGRFTNYLEGEFFR